jgi:hypothetical protein
LSQLLLPIQRFVSLAFADSLDVSWYPYFACHVSAPQVGLAACGGSFRVPLWTRPAKWSRGLPLQARSNDLGKLLSLLTLGTYPGSSKRNECCRHYRQVGLTLSSSAQLVRSRIPAFHPLFLSFACLGVSRGFVSPGLFTVPPPPIFVDVSLR